MRRRAGFAIITGFEAKTTAERVQKYMAPIRFSKSHEREEGRLLRKGLAHSWAGLLLCWLPVIGLAFSASGFWRVMVRLTRRHRKRRKAYLAFSFIVLFICTGVLLGEIWIYSRDPEIIDRTAQQAWAFIVGEENVSAPADEGAQGVEYGDMNSAGFGLTDGMWPDKGNWTAEDWAAEGFAEAEDDFDWAAWEEEEWGLEGDSAFDESELDWNEDDFWLDEEWSDETLTAENSLTSAEDDLTAFTGKEAAWLAGEGSAALGEASPAADTGSASVGKGETILPPLE